MGKEELCRQNFPYPNFASELEEAEWLYEHRDELEMYFSPSAITLSEVLLAHDLVLPAAVVTVSLSVDDSKKLNEIAKAEGLAPEDFAGRLVHNALQSKQEA